ncbi:uncharacterized protein LOC121387839 isoform X2 [Gigantopelta aegis]|uniref:uncharacterized protein LOC121387839 isoform X2 n=1 Tax=Gigantopelta aegis TaxID=1735272 RepID=UPI001B88DC28|nr:uncharacterized protein LOC121387839 isoform X2 [Gigantopelta aegis]
MPPKRRKLNIGPGHSSTLWYQYLAAQTVKIASMNGLGEVTKLENDLAAEIEREDAAPPKETVARLRRRGDAILHSKMILLLVVLLNVLDTLLVLGELIMDFKHMGNVISSHADLSEEFLVKMSHIYPSQVDGITVIDIDKLFDKIIHARILWNKTNLEDSGICNVTPQSGDRVERSADIFYPNETSPQENITHHEAGYTLEVKLAHGFHYASVSILAVLVVETALKIICAGKHFFHSRMQVFDAVVITVSFTIDLVFIKGLMGMEATNFMIVLAFLLPWRVIRVVNSLIVAVIDKERFQMKLLYKQKKKVDKHYADSQEKNSLLQKEIDALRALCKERGIEIDNILPGAGHSQPSGGAIHALGRFARRTADSLTPALHNGAKRSPSPRKKNGMPWSCSVEEPTMTSTTNDLSRYSNSTPNLPIIIEKNMDKNESDTRL